MRDGGADRSGQERSARIKNSLRDLPGRRDLAHLLWEVTARVGALLEPALVEELNLSRPSLGVLRLVGHTPGITASEIARVAFKTQQAASQITARLERHGYIERRLGAGRGVGLHITPAGERAVEQGIRAVRAADRQLASVLGADVHAQLREALERALDVLDERA